MIPYVVFWIHPEKNAEHCWYYNETPGDLPNFWVSIEREERADESVDDLAEVLLDLLRRATASAPRVRAKAARFRNQWHTMQ